VAKRSGTASFGCFNVIVFVLARHGDRPRPKITKRSQDSLDWRRFERMMRTRRDDLDKRPVQNVLSWMLLDASDLFQPA
jgi:hypothetical protein